MPDTPKETVLPSKSGETENGLKKPEDDAGSDHLHESDGSLSDCQSDDTIDSKDYDKLSNHSSPTNRTPLTQKKKDKSEDPLCEENSSTLKKTHETNQEKLSETAAVPTSNVNKQHFSDKDYCLFCSKPVIHKARHLARIQSDKVEVAVTFQCPLHLRERKKIWKNRTNKRHFAHNNVLKTGKRQPNKRAKSAHFIHCVYCDGLYRKEHLFNHMKNCSEKAKYKDKPPGKPMISLCELLSTKCEDLSEEFKNVLDEMEYDEVTEAVMEDQTILQFGEHMLNEVGFNVSKHEYIRQNLRHVARLVLEAQKSTPMQSLEDFFNPWNFQHVVSAVKIVAGYDAEKKTYTLPLLAHDLGYHLQIICSIVVRNAVSCGDFRVMELCKNFLSLYSKKWNRIISSRAGANITETKGKNEKDVPIAEDEKRLRLDMENVHHRDEKKLMTCDDTNMETGVKEQPSSEQQGPTEHHGVDSSSSFGSSHPNPQQDRDVTTSMSPPPKSKSEENGIHDFQHRVVRRWDEEEIQAVEKHLMSLIEEQRCPLKEDCVRCLEAEPHALRNRSWRVLRDYVKNRIVALQRQSGCQRKLTNKRSRKKKPKQRFV